MTSKALGKILGSLLLAAVAAALVFRTFFGGKVSSEEMVFFYDLSEQKLFPAPRDSVPPIRGINNDEQDGVRAIVISNASNPRDKKQQRIAYLEKYTPQMKAAFEAVRKDGASAESSAGLIRREMVPANTLVRRPTETQWHLMKTPEGEKILTEWNVPGPDGNYPTVCAP